MANGTQYSFQRIEKKYFISPAQAETMLGEMRRHMTADRYGEYAIGNIYCDTDNFRLIRASLEKPAYKEKLRIRCYGVPKAGDKVFVELKKKCGGVVYKRRVTAPLPQAERFLRTETAPAEWGQIGQELQWFQRFYDTMPRMYIGYDRTAWAGTEDPALRITFDRGQDPRSLPSVAVPGAFRSVYLSRLVFEIRRLLQRDVPGGQCPRADE